MDKKALVNKSIDYILTHLEEPISIEDVANQLSFSKYYFCRMFKEVTGEGVYSFIKRLKVEQSAIDLKLQKDKRITDIGLDYGYSASNYSSLFKEHYQLSPNDYRKSLEASTISNPFYPQKQEVLDTFEDYQKKVELKELNDLYVIYERMLGNYAELKSSWSALVEENAYYDDTTVMIEKFYNDPAVAIDGHSICDLCFTLNEEIKEKNTMVITGGTYAIYPYKGQIEDIFRVMQGFFRIWLPESSYRMREKYGLTIYRKIDWENDYVQLDMCIPVE
ncbi:AraC family transcriptional regulator [Enterococcus avium]